MQLKQLFDDDTAVSPVIGVILMVAITVILAAVIGTFVLGLGDSIGENAPSASYDWDQESASEDANNVTLTHVSGQNINPDRVTANVVDDDANDDAFGDVWAGGDSSVSSGDRVKIVADEEGVDSSVDDREVPAENDLESDTEVRIIWTASGGGSSSTLTTYTVN